MRLLSLEVENVRRFRGAHRIAAFGPRLNVLCGPNEFGKSTLLASLSAAFFHKHGAKTQITRALQTHGSETAPVVRVGFDLGEGAWRLEKRFLQRPAARLVGPDGRAWEGDAAESRLAALLGFDVGGKPGQSGLWEALWVAQGKSFAQAEVESGLARGTLAECLEAELGGVAGFGRGDALLRRVEAELAELSDPSGRPKGERRRLREELGEVEARIGALEDRRARLAEDVAALRSDEARRAAVRREIEAGRERAEIAAARETLLRTERAAADREAAEEVLARLAAERNAIRAEIDGRAKTLRREEQAQVESAALNAAAAAAASLARSAEEALILDRATLDAAEAELTEAERAAEAARRAANAGEDRVRLGAAAGRLERARRLEDQIAAAVGRVAGAPVDRAGLERLREATRACEGLRERMAMAATRVEILEPAAGVVFTLSAGGRSGPAPASFAATEEADLIIEGVGTVRIRPPMTGRDATRQKLAEAERLLARALAAAGLAGLEEAEAAFAAREQAEAELAGLRASLARLVPGDEAASLAPGVTALAAFVEALRQRVATFDDEGAGVEALEVRRAEADAARREAIARVQVARARHEAASVLAATRRAEAAGQRDAAERALREAVSLGAARAEAEMARPLAVLEAIAEKAARDERDARARLASISVDGDAITPTALHARIGRLEEAVANREAEHGRLGERLARLREGIDREGGAGIDEQLEAARRAADMLERRLAVLDGAAASLGLLRNVLREAVADVRTETMGPLTRRVAPKLEALLPGATVECNDGFQITTVSRGTGLPEPFGLLSDGTREQIAVITRLAYAEMLADRGRPAMMILDDALAFSDGARMEQMFDVLAEAATRVQVLVMTCREDLFGRLGGTRLSLEAA